MDTNKREEFGFRCELPCAITHQVGRESRRVGRWLSPLIVTSRIRADPAAAIIQRRLGPRWVQGNEHLTQALGRLESGAGKRSEENRHQRAEILALPDGLWYASAVRFVRFGVDLPKPGATPQRQLTPETKPFAFIRVHSRLVFRLWP